MAPNEDPYGPLWTASHAKWQGSPLTAGGRQQQRRSVVGGHVMRSQTHTWDGMAPWMITKHGWRAAQNVNRLDEANKRHGSDMWTRKQYPTGWEWLKLKLRNLALLGLLPFSSINQDITKQQAAIEETWTHLCSWTYAKRRMKPLHGQSRVYKQWGQCLWVFFANINQQRLQLRSLS